MPRPLILSNGNLLVCYDSQLDIRDFYWPYVGMHNHLSGHRARTGIWVDGQFRWLADSSWRRKLRYQAGTLVTDATAINDELRVEVSMQDCVLHRHDVLMRRFVITNHEPRQREVRLFLAHDFHIAETDIGDTAFYNPYIDAMVHYKRDNYFLIAAMSASGGIYQYATGIKGFGGAEGTWRDAEDGQLAMNPVAQGSVDSTLSVRATLPPNGHAEVRSWLCAGHTLGEVTRDHQRIISEGFETLVRDTERYWLAWSNKGCDRVANLPEPIPEVFRRSILTIRAHTDNRGAIIAANDSDIMETARAHYSYMWPRDGALVAACMDTVGYTDLTRRFFTFCRKVLPQDRAALLHKYSADGSWGATWHPWTVDGHAEIPFQEDSTALTVWAIWKHYQRHRDLEFIESVYDAFVIPCADFLADYRDPDTGLPLPSYDLWEERRGVHAYTCGTLYGALSAAANLSDVFDDGHAAEYREAMASLRRGIETYLWDDGAGRFARRLIPVSREAVANGEAPYQRDMTIDSALHALFAFGAFPADDPRIQSTMRAVISRLWVQTSIGGLARYEDDYYFRRSPDTHRIPGNPWFICTLWAAQWYIKLARRAEELATALELIMWAAKHAMESGVLAEQLHPETGEALSVAPLTWSHAEFVATVHEYVDRYQELAGRPA